MQKFVFSLSVMTIISGAINFVGASEKQKKFGEKQPWSDYHVHDKERPHPRKVKTSGAVTVKAPNDAIVIFDSEHANTDALTKNWKIKDGVLIASPGNTSTKQSFGSVQLHLEWKVPAGRKVKGQSGGNSGVFLMDRYEVQIQESHTNVTYADGQAAALYGQMPPLVNASVPQGEWQSYDIIFKAPVYEGKTMKEPAMITVIHNGVIVHHCQKFYGTTTHRKVAKYPENHPAKAPIQFQWHSDPIEFRNIWVREL